MLVAGHTLRVGYIGSVSVHRLSRGAGHMKKLMQMQMEKARADGLDMLVLGGQRQRYGYFGFSPVGGAYSYTVTHANVRHALKDTDASVFSFELLKDNEDSAYAYALYQSQPVCGSRTAENFAEIALTFNSQGWIVKWNGMNAGYLIAASDHGEIRELVMEDASSVPAVIKAWMAVHGVRYLNVRTAPCNKPLNRALSAFAEDYTIGQDSCMLCLHYANVIRSWMTLKNCITPLSDGLLHLGIADEVLDIKVDTGTVTVQKSDSSADVQLTPAEVDQLLFGFNRFYAPEVMCAIPADWFPLPFSIPTIDTF